MHVCSCHWTPFELRMLVELHHYCKVTCDKWTRMRTLCFCRLLWINDCDIKLVYSRIYIVFFLHYWYCKRWTALIVAVSSELSVYCMCIHTGWHVGHALFSHSCITAVIMSFLTKTDREIFTQRWNLSYLMAKGDIFSKLLATCIQITLIC